MLEAARSLELTVVWLLDESPPLLAASGGVPRTTEFVWNVWTMLGAASLVHV